MPALPLTVRAVSYDEIAKARYTHYTFYAVWFFPDFEDFVGVVGSPTGWSSVNLCFTDPDGTYQPERGTRLRRGGSLAGAVKVYHTYAARNNCPLTPRFFVIG